MANFLSSQWTGRPNPAVTTHNYGTPGYSTRDYLKYSTPNGQAQTPTRPRYERVPDIRATAPQQRYQCFNCQEMGHFKRDCPYLLEFQMNQQSGQKNARRATQQRSHAARVYLKVKIRG